ncbi:hypothetical protein [Alicyclobacillus dauci]|uniref:Uncharacterized protein n=1 Tax=Alicyclobacillus dauci TaxID=1475485 RepID=A0ABY6Z164_9BACL|nr:hypothetical protein [Alicyclobacillus dauci]WAH36619.1 hypothetical protein NZD86_20960 [Alicyclobacillus dauci]
MDQTHGPHGNIVAIVGGAVAIIAAVGTMAMKVEVCKQNLIKRRALDHLFQ